MFLTSKTLSRFFLPIIILLVAGSGYFYWVMQSKSAPIPDHLKDLGGDFVLQSADGSVALSDFRNKVVLIFFGYTNCPDICPMTLSNWAASFNALSKPEIENVKGIFVSVDPGRDTPESLKQYTEYFHTNIVGVTGSHDQLKKITAAYRSDYSLEGGGKGADYTVDHMSFVYVVDAQGKVRDLLSHDSSPEEITNKISAVLQVKGE